MKQEVDGIPYRTSDLNHLILQRSTPKKPFPWKIARPQK
jgi:hypothetical protein